MRAQSSRRAFQRRSITLASSPSTGIARGCLFFENSAGSRMALVAEVVLPLEPPGLSDAPRGPEEEADEVGVDLGEMLAERVHLLPAEESAAHGFGVLGGLLDLRLGTGRDELFLDGESEPAIEEGKLDPDGGVAGALSPSVLHVVLDPVPEPHRLRLLAEERQEVLERVPHAGDRAVAAEAVV